MTSPARPVRAALALAAVLALGSAVSLGLARFSYALLLPPMRADLGWSYFTSGAMNTVNAAGYLAGALLASRALARIGGRTLFLGGMWATALVLALHGAVASDAALYALRFLAGLASAATFVSGGLLAARLVSDATAPASSSSSSSPSPSPSPSPGRASAGLVLGIYYGGTGLGIVAATLLVPRLVERAVAHAWQSAWLGLGLLAAAAALVAWRGTRSIVAPPVAASSRAGSGAAVRRLAPALLAYFGFGVGYIGYMTFVVALLREEGLSGPAIEAFYALLGLAVMASSWLWARLLQRFRGGGAMAILDALLAVATLLPVLSRHPAVAFASGLLFGAVFLSVVASTTALVRHNLSPADWPRGIAAFTAAFAFGQIIGPGLIGWVGDRAGGLAGGFVLSAAVLAVSAVVAGLQRPLPLLKPAGAA